MQTPKMIFLPDPDDVKDIETLRQFLKALLEQLREEHLNVYEDLRSLSSGSGS